MIAALFVERGGVYWDLPGVDAWDETRDARLYAGPWPGGGASTVLEVVQAPGNGQ